MTLLVGSRFVKNDKVPNLVDVARLPILSCLETNHLRSGQCELFKPRPAWDYTPVCDSANANCNYQPMVIRTDAKW